MVETGYIKPEKFTVGIIVPNEQIKNAAVCDFTKDDTNKPKPVDANTNNIPPVNVAANEPFIGTPNQNTIIALNITKLNAPITK